MTYLKISTILAILVLAGCASTNDNLDRQIAQVEMRETFEHQQADCSKYGGAMAIRTRPSRIKTDRHSSADYKLATCHIK